MGAITKQVHHFRALPKWDEPPLLFIAIVWYIISKVCSKYKESLGQNGNFSYDTLKYCKE